MANNENLKPFTGADDPRRMNGKPKGMEHSSTRLKRLLSLSEKMANPVTGEIEGFTVLEQMDLALIIKARKGDIKAYQAVMDRLEGKPPQAIKYDGTIKTANKYEDLSDEELERAKEALLNDVTQRKESSEK